MQSDNARLIDELIQAKKILYLDAASVASLGVFDFKANVPLIAESYLNLYANEVQLPHAQYLKYPGRSTYDRVIPLLGHLGGSFGVSGLKVIGSAVGNKALGFERASALTLLLDKKTQRPFCILEGAQISAARTASVSAVAIRQLAPLKVNRVALIGCGYLAKVHLQMWTQVFAPPYPVFVGYDVSAQALDNFKDLAGNLAVDFTPAMSAKEAISNADIIVPCTTEETPYIEADWLKPEALYCAVSLLDPKLEVLELSDLIVVDNLESCLQEGRPLQRLAQQGRLPRERLVSIGELLAFERFPRTGGVGSKRIFFNPMGTVITDIALAQTIFCKARAQKIGVLLGV